MFNILNKFNSITQSLHIKEEFEKHVKLASFIDWSANAYLRDYYSVVEQDEVYTLQFLVEEFKKIKNNPIGLDFGAGPTVHHILPLTPYVSEIHISDYLKNNIGEIQKWQKKEKGMHDWKPFTKLILEYENNTVPSIDEILIREDDTRKKIKKYFCGDASLQDPLGREFREKYDFVLSCYCADSATSSKEVWGVYMKNIISLVKPGGFFVTSALRKCRYYKVGDKFFPCADVNELDVEKLFVSLDFDMSTANIVVKDVPEQTSVGYESIVLASGFKK